MPEPLAIRNEINRIVSFLVERGLSADQNFAIFRDPAGGPTEVTFPTAAAMGAAAGRLPYVEMYDACAAERAYTAKLLDGAIIQLEYTFYRRDLMHHRLTWFPSPHLLDFQQNADLYENDEVYADIVAGRIITFPLRFDFDRRHIQAPAFDHPGSHATLGQYVGCRIPVSRPITPSWFFDFILRNFYAPAFTDVEECPKVDHAFETCITDDHSRLIHLAVPQR